MPRRASRTTLALAVLPLFIVACGGPPPSAPRTAALVGESADAELFTVDWPTSMRADLEASARSGLAVVSRVPGAPLRVLSECKVDAPYRVETVTLKEDVVRLASRDEVTASLPFGGLGLWGRATASAAEERVVDIAIVTRSRATAPALAFSSAELRGQCDGATHVVTVLTRGAFAVAVRTKRDRATAAEILGYGASARASSDALVAERDGDPSACAGDAEAARRCAAIIKVGLRAIASTNALTSPVGATGWWKQVCTTDTACRGPCDGGDSASCVSLGMLAMRDRDERTAERYLRAACDAKVPMGCTGLGMLYDPLKNARGLADGAKARSLYARACDLGSLDGCQMLGLKIGSDPSFRLEDEADVARVTKACMAGSAMACFAAAGWFQRKSTDLVSAARPGAEAAAITGSKAALDAAIEWEKRYCAAASAKELAEHPCHTNNWLEVRRAIQERFPSY